MATLLISINFIHLLSANPKLCNNASQCVGQTISANSNDVYGGGYKSIFKTTSSITSAKAVNCYGSFSCSEISSVRANSVSCYGSNSCSKAKQISVTNSTNPFIYGLGALSLSNSIIISSASSNDFKCGGDQSCADSRIKTAQNIYASAAYSLLNATIETVGDTDIYLGGYFAGYGATFRCNSGHHCNISCAVNACFMLHVDCKGTCYVNKNSVDSIGPNISVSTSTLINEISSIDMLDLLYDTATITATNDESCSNQPKSLRSDNYKQRYQGNDIKLFSSKGPICCRGSTSCSYIPNIQHYSQTTESIICSGRSSCSFTNIESNGSVFCSASSSCWSSNIATVETIYCLAQVSCEYARIAKPFTVYCSGYRSCYLSSISSFVNDTNLYFLGFQSGKNGTIQCDSPHLCSIFCYGQDSCLYLTLSGNGTFNIECSEDSKCPEILELAFNPTEIILTKFIPSMNPIININHVFQLITVVIVAVLAVGIIGATFHSKRLRHNDYFKVGSLIAAAMAILDFLSDIFFVTQITYHPEFVMVLSLTKPLWIIFVLSVMFLIAPILISLVQINHIIAKHWMKNDQIRAWLNNYIYYLYLLSLLSGSSFSAISICSSGTFGTSFCNIPLSKKEKTHFSYKRVYSIVMLENIPEVLMGIWFIIATKTSVDSIVYISMVFSLLSILMTIMSLHTAKQLVSTQDHCIVTFNVKGNMFTDDNIDFCRENTSRIKKNIGIILGLNESMIEITKPEQISYGLSITVFLYIEYTAALDLNPQKLIIEAHSDNSLGEHIKSCWNLSSLPSINDIHYEQHYSKHGAQKRVNIQTTAAQMIDLGQPTAKNEESVLDDYHEGNEALVTLKTVPSPQIDITP